METETWYYEYIIKIWDDLQSEEEKCCGIVLATSLTDAMDKISLYYDNIIEVQMLKEIIEGPVFDFQDVAECYDFDFIVC